MGSGLVISPVERTRRSSRRQTWCSHTAPSAPNLGPSRVISAGPRRAAATHGAVRTADRAKDVARADRGVGGHRVAGTRCPDPSQQELALPLLPLANLALLPSAASAASAAAAAAAAFGGEAPANARRRPHRTEVSFEATRKDGAAELGLAVVRPEGDVVPGEQRQQQRPVEGGAAGEEIAQPLERRGEGRPLWSVEEEEHLLGEVRHRVEHRRLEVLPP